MAIAFFIVFSSLLSWCVNQDASYYIHKPKPPVTSELKGKI